MVTRVLSGFANILYVSVSTGLWFATVTAVQSSAVSLILRSFRRITESDY